MDLLTVFFFLLVLVLAYLSKTLKISKLLAGVDFLVWTS